MEKPTVSLPILVEGKYDKIKLDSLISGRVIPLGGFSLFNRRDRIAFLRKIAEGGGVIVLTDSDGGGRQIRSFLSECLPKEKVFHLYIPAVEGKEKRKRVAGKAGLLGVEGTDKDTLLSLLRPFFGEGKKETGLTLTKADLYSDGLLGGEGSARKREKLCRALSLPPDLSPNALLGALSLACTEEEYRRALSSIQEENSDD